MLLKDFYGRGSLLKQGPTLHSLSTSLGIVTAAHLCGKHTASLQSPTPPCSEAFVMKLQAAKWNTNCKANFHLVSLPQQKHSLQELMFEFLTFDTQKLATKSSVFLRLHLRWLVNWWGSDFVKVRQKRSAKSVEKFQVANTENDNCNKCKMSMHRCNDVHWIRNIYVYLNAKNTQIMNMNTKTFQNLGICGCLVQIFQVHDPPNLAWSSPVPWPQINVIKLVGAVTVCRYAGWKVEIWMENEERERCRNAERWFELPDPESFVLRRVGIRRLRLLSPSPVCFESQKLTQLK